jgi:hypothetical protein
MVPVAIFLFVFFLLDSLFLFLCVSYSFPTVSMDTVFYCKSLSLFALSLLKKSLFIPVGTLRILFVQYRSGSLYHNSLKSVVNPLKPSGKYIYHRVLRSVTLHVVFMDLVRFSVYTAIISLNSVNHLIFLMTKCGVLFEVRTEFLNII